MLKNVKEMKNMTYRMNRLSRGSFTLLGMMSMIVLLVMMGCPIAVAETAEKAPAAEPAPKSGLEEALKKLKLPGVKINLKERCVDVDAFFCLANGALELIACTKDSKEHESIIAVEAKAKHIHTALLLIGAKSGNPAMQKPANKEKTRWVHIPPRGGPVDVSLVFKNKQGKEVERPISDFIESYEDEFSDQFYDDKEAVDEEKEEKFPTNTFLFAGSILHGKGEGPRNYLADQSGNVITLATFGDELLCLPGVYSHAAGAFAWQVKDTHLPEVGTKAKLRLRPKIVPAPTPATAPDADAVPVK